MNRALVLGVTSAYLFLWLPVSGHGMTPVPDGQMAKINRCERLMAVRTRSLVPSAEVRRYIGLAQLGLRSLLGVEPQIRTNFKLALQSPTPVNPFLNLSSYQGKAWALQIEEVIGFLDSYDWGHVVPVFRELLNEAGTNSIQSQQDAVDTAEVRLFHFLPYESLVASMDHGLVGRVSIAGGRHLGQTAAGHHIVQFGVNRSTSVFGIASITNSLGTDGQPQIKWLTRNIVSWNTPIYETLSPDEKRLAKVDSQGMWIIDGHLYAVLQPSVFFTDSYAFVELDPNTGLIIQEVPMPSSGYFEFFRLSRDQVAAVRFGPDPKGVRTRIAYDVYRFDSKSKRFSKTDLKLESLDIYWLSRASIEGMAFMTGLHGKYRLDFSNVFLPSEDFVEEPGYKVWSITEAIHKEKLLVGSQNYLRFTVRQQYHAIPDGDAEKVQTFEPSPDWFFSLPVADAEDKEIEISGAANMQTAMIHRNSGGGLGEMWWVEKATLDHRKIDLPDMESLRIVHGIKKPFDAWRLRANHLGQHILMGLSREDRKSLSFRFNPSTSQFEEPSLGVLPDTEKNLEVFLSEDYRSIIGNSSGSGVWLQMQGHLHRERLE